MGYRGIGGLAGISSTPFRGTGVSGFSVLETLEEKNLEDAPDRENSGECPRERTSEGVECAPARPTTSTTRTSGTHRASFIPPKSAPGQPDSSDDDRSSSASSNGSRDPRKTNIPSTSRRARRRSLPPLATPPEAPNDYLIDPSQFAGRDAGKGLAKLPEPESYSDRAKDPSTLTKWVRNVRTWLLVGNIHEESYMAMAFINACLSGPARDWMEKTVVDGLQKTYSRNLAEAGNIRSPWPLERIARHLEKGFVSQTSHRDAETERHRISSRGRTDTEGPSVN